MRIGVRLGPVWVSTSTRSRHRSRPRQPNWHATSHTMTPDGREVDFRCHHNHRTQAAAIDCASAIRKQIQHGQGLHLVTKVRSTPTSREADRQRAQQKAAHRLARAAQRAQTALHRAQEQQARREAKKAQRVETSQQREAARQQRARRDEVRTLQQRQHVAEQAVLRDQAALQRRERREQAAHQRAEQWTQLRQRNDERWDRVHQRRTERSQERRPRGWPIPGLIVASAAMILGAILAGLAGNNSHGTLAATAGGLITLGILALLICAVATLWRRVRSGKRNLPYQPIPENQNGPAAYRSALSTSPAGYNDDPYRSQTAAGYPPYTTPPARTGSVPPWE